MKKISIFLLVIASFSSICFSMPCYSRNVLWYYGKLIRATAMDNLKLYTGVCNLYLMEKKFLRNCSLDEEVLDDLVETGWVRRGDNKDYFLEDHVVEIFDKVTVFGNKGDFHSFEWNRLEDDEDF